jgi:hypothetical protein
MNRLHAFSAAAALAAALGAGEALSADAQNKTNGAQTKTNGAQEKTDGAQAKAAKAGKAKKMDRASINRMIQDWPAENKSAADTLMQKYGMPQEATPHRLVWHDNGPWKRTTLIREQIDHNFPVPHKDYLEQAIPYNAPVDRFDELATYDGSVIVDRTRGEIAARCDKEGMNFTALNLANDVATGKVEVEEARNQYAQIASQFMKGQKPEYTQGFRFQVPRDYTGDPDQRFEGQISQAKKKK